MASKANTIIRWVIKLEVKIEWLYEFYFRSGLI